MPDPELPLCKVCKTEEATMATEPPGKDGVARLDICRDCELDRLYDLFSCPECHQLVIRRDLSPNSHDATCSQRSPPCEVCGGDREHKDDCDVAHKGLFRRTKRRRPN
jgi:hypothetical protein